MLLAGNGAFSWLQSYIMFSEFICEAIYNDCDELKVRIERYGKN